MKRPSARLLGPCGAALLVLLGAACADFSFVDPPDEEPVRLDPLDAEGALSGHAGDRVVVRGANLRDDVRVTFEPEGIDGVLVETQGERLVVEVPDLGAAGSRTVRAHCDRGGSLVEARADFRFLGAGQLRTMGVVDSSNIASPFRQLFGALVVPQTSAAAATAQRDLLLAADETVFGLSTSDFVAPLSVDTNLLSYSAEFARPLLGAAAVGHASVLGSGTEARWFPVATVFAVDTEGRLRSRLGAFARGAPDAGWIYASIAEESVAWEGSMLAEPRVAAFPDVKAIAAPARSAGQAARLVVANRNGEGQGRLSIVSLAGSSAGYLSVAGVRQADLPAKKGSTLGLVATASAVYASGLVQADPEGPGLLWEVKEGIGGAPQLVAIPVRNGSNGTQPLERALAYEGEGKGLLALSVAATNDDKLLAISFFDGPLPRLALLVRTSATEPFTLLGTGASGVIYYGLTFARHQGQPALYASEAVGSRVVRIDPATFMPASAALVPGSSAPLTPLAMASAAGGTRLLVTALGSSDALQLSTDSDTFLLPILVNRSWGALRVLETSPEPNVLALSERSSSRPAGDIALVSPQGPLCLGGSGPGNLQATMGPLVFDVEGRVPAALLVSGTIDGEPFLRSTLLSAGREAEGRGIYSAACSLGWVVQDAVSNPGVGALMLVASPVSGQAETRLVWVPAQRVRGDLSSETEVANQLCGLVDEAAEQPLWSAPRDCDGSLVFAAGGRSFVHWKDQKDPSCPRLSTIVDGKVSQELSLPEGVAGVIGIDRKDCSETFKPALFATTPNGLVAVTLDEQDSEGECAGARAMPTAGWDGGCQSGGTEPGVVRLCAGLGRVVALEPSPNGQRLYVLSDRQGSRTVIEVKIDRDADGQVIKMAVVGEAPLASLAGWLDKSFPGGLAMKSDGTRLYATVSSESEIVTLE